MHQSQCAPWWTVTLQNATHECVFFDQQHSDDDAVKWQINYRSSFHGAKWLSEAQILPQAATLTTSHPHVLNSGVLRYIYSMCVSVYTSDHPYAQLLFVFVVG